VVVSATLTGTVTLTSTCPVDYTLTSTIPAQVLHSCAPTGELQCVQQRRHLPQHGAALHAHRESGVCPLPRALRPRLIEASFGGSATGRWSVALRPAGRRCRHCPIGAVDLTQALGSLASGRASAPRRASRSPMRIGTCVLFVCDSTNCPPAGVTAQ
jgi:hypothetical protein